MCALRTATCGSVLDDCGASVPCGICPPAFECELNQCAVQCIPRSCDEVGAECGTIDDGCGGTRDCPGCDAGKYCDTNNSCTCHPSLGSRTLGQTEYSGSSADWDEFTNSIALPDFRMGVDGAASLRPWIGHSECSTCTPGTPKKQRFSFTHLIPGDVYRLRIHPAWVRGNAYYSALVTSGSATIRNGDRKEFPGKSGYLTSADEWVVEFQAHSPALSIALGHGLRDGTHYIYIDSYEFAPENACR